MASMNSQTAVRNAVAAIRVSTQKQGIEGDSPDDQLRQIMQYAAAHNAAVVKQFTFMESASKEQQPMQEAVNFCKDPTNNVQLFIVKSIDRFTRAGSLPYETLKNQLEACDVTLLDIYGIIGTQRINTLEHLGVKYKWSEYSPTKKAEMLEAERAMDEIRDIQTRMIGAQIRYARMGYWVRRALYGFNNVHIETREGKRCILEPNPTEAPLVIKMFELRARGTMSDEQIVEELNQLGFRSYESLVRSKEDRTKIVRSIGGKPLTIKHMWRLLENPVYAGINPEKWTQGKPVKCAFAGLVSYELFNAANRGKIVVGEDRDGVYVRKRLPPPYIIYKGVRNVDFPYKRIVMCPSCRNPLYGSASRGRLGTYYPAYHCCHRGHYFRKSKREFDATIEAFVSSLNVSPEYIGLLRENVGKAYDRQLIELHGDDVSIDLRLTELRSQIRQSVDKIKFLNSQTAITYLEEDIVKLESEVKELEEKRRQATPQQPVDMDKVHKYVSYYLEHINELLFNIGDPELQARYFGVIFNEAPTYDEIVLGTPDCRKIPCVNRVFVPKFAEPYNENALSKNVAGETGLEPATNGFGDRYSTN